MISSGNISTSNRNDSGLSRKRTVSAAGRMVKEGGKGYEYGWLDKVLSVSENGQKVASFNYHNDGQIAQAIRNGKSEDFLWDGLALIHRGGTSFVNEPYVTGGNPILSSKDGVMFNDMLGSTLNIGGKTIHMTAFGETKDTDALFTGKPDLGELCYAFLFRNYRADQGKWQTSDPLGYPDGWNNLAYCNNEITNYIDIAGCIMSGYIEDQIKREITAQITSWFNAKNVPAMIQAVLPAQSSSACDDLNIMGIFYASITGISFQYTEIGWFWDSEVSSQIADINETFPVNTTLTRTESSVYTKRNPQGDRSGPKIEVKNSSSTVTLSNLNIEKTVMGKGARLNSITFTFSFNGAATQTWLNYVKE